MPKGNEVDEKVRPVAWIVTNGGESCEPWIEYEKSEVDALPAVCIAEPLYSAATVAELRAEVERLREANQLYSFAMNTAGIDELKRRADAAERRVGELIEIISRVARCSYSVCTRIDLRGRRWSEAYLDQVLPDILATLTGADPT